MDKEQKEIFEALIEEFGHTLSGEEVSKIQKALENRDYVIFEGNLIIFEENSRMPLFIFSDIFN